MIRRLRHRLVRVETPRVYNNGTNVACLVDNYSAGWPAACPAADSFSSAREVGEQKHQIRQQVDTVDYAAAKIVPPFKSSRLRFVRLGG